MDDLLGAGLTGDPVSVAVAERDRVVLELVAEALQRDRVMLAFQPVVLGADPGRVAFHEGLLRVVDDTGRLIPAREFIWAVETRELGRTLDCVALRLGFEALATEPSLRLAVNMSARSIGYPRWMQVLNDGLARDPTAGERLILEITESSAMLMPELVTVFMADLQRRGVAFALDDFGAGYTAFRYLREFDFDVLKIDGQFVRGVAHDPDSQVLLRALLSIGQHFDMLTIAESVENAEDAEWVRAAGVDCLQGYFFGMPTVNPAWATPGRRWA